MTEHLKNFINNMSMLCETWIITYNAFVERGFKHADAIEHTKAFMTAFMEAATQNK